MDSNSNNGTASGGSIREARLALHLSQEDLARRADCSTVYVRMIEGGYTPTESSVIPRIMRALKEERPDRAGQVALTTSTAGQGRHEPE
jgi:predicted transcriptional regulator